jgi:hypothetical protein
MAWKVIPGEQLQDQGISHDKGGFSKTGRLRLY